MGVAHGPDVRLTVRPLPGGGVELKIEHREREWVFPLARRAALRLADQVTRAAQAGTAPIRS